MNQGVVEHHNLYDVAESRAANTDPPAVIEFCDLLVVETEFIAMQWGQSNRATLVLDSG